MRVCVGVECYESLCKALVYEIVYVCKALVYLGECMEGIRIWYEIVYKKGVESQDWM